MALLAKSAYSCKSISSSRQQLPLFDAIPFSL